MFRNAWNTVFKKCAKKDAMQEERGNCYTDVDESFLTGGKHSFPVTGGTVEYFVHADIQPGSTIPVFFHAAIDRRKIELPRFEGLGMCKKNQWAGISFADPVLPMYDSCSLAWFVGNDRFYRLQLEIHDFLKTIGEKWNLTFVFHGGSGGGFAALVQKSFFHNQHFAIVQNPQTNIFDLSRQHLINYFLTYETHREEAQYQAVLEEYGFRYKISASQVTDVLYFQNFSDELHVKKHLKPFLENRYKVKHNGIHFRKQNNHIYVGDWGKGHATLPADVLEGAMKYVIQNRSFSGIERFIEQMEQLHLLTTEQYNTLFEQ